MKLKCQADYFGEEITQLFLITGGLQVPPKTDSGTHFPV